MKAGGTFWLTGIQYFSPLSLREAIEPDSDIYCRSYIDTINEMLIKASKRTNMLLDSTRILTAGGSKEMGAQDWSFTKNVDTYNNDGFGGTSLV